MRATNRSTTFLVTYFLLLMVMNEISAVNFLLYPKFRVRRFLFSSWRALRRNTGMAVRSNRWLLARPWAIPPGPKFKRGCAVGCNGPRGQKPPGPNSKTRWHRWAQTHKQDGVVGPKLENKMAPGFRLGEVGMVAWFRLWK